MNYIDSILSNSFFFLKWMKKMYYGNTNQKKPRVATLVSDKVDFRARISVRDKEGDFTVTQGVSSSRGQNNPK